MCVIQPQCVRLKRIMYSKRRKIRDAAEQVEWIVRRIAVELIFKKCFVRRPPAMIKSKPKRVRSRFEFADRSIVLNRVARYVWRRIQPRECEALLVETAGRNAVSGESESCF